MKVFVLSKNGKMLKIGNTPEDSKFYFLTPELTATHIVTNPDKTFSLKTLKMGTDVDITQETRQGSAYITSLKVVGAQSVAAPVAVAPKVAVQQTVVPTTAEPSVVVKKAWNNPVPPTQHSGEYGKSPAVQESIKRQACAHATTRALVSMQGKFADVQQLAQAFDYLYDIIEAKVSN